MQDKLIFTTLFNSYYICKGITMYESLSQTCDDFHLYVFAYDEKSYTFLQQKGYPNVTVISLVELETYFPQLLGVKSERTLAEYCWTTTSFTISYCLENFEIDHCIYIDADLYFISNPRVLVDELRDDDVMITEHQYTPCYDHSATSGKYCVQFIVVKNNKNGRSVMDWWKNACYQWCYNRYEDGKFGDQKYLDDWTTRFEKIHVLQHLGILAPWNVQQYTLNTKCGTLLARENCKNNIFHPVVYHFHYFRCNRLLGLVEYIFGPYKLSKEVLQYIYMPYMLRVGHVHRFLREYGFTDDELGYAKIDEPNWRKPLHLIKTLFRTNKRIRQY